MAYVTAFSFAERFLGFVYRIFLSRRLGAEGLGLYQIALSVLGLFMTAASSGIPITVSRIITKNKAEKDVNDTSAAVTGGILLALAVSVPLTLLTLSKSKILSFLFSDERCLGLLSIMIPGLIFTSVYAVIRGSFWGNTQFLTYSVIEFAEEGVMALAGIILVSTATNTMRGTEFAAYAVLISYIFSFAVSSIVFLVRGGRLKNPKPHLKPLIVSSAPVTFMRTGTSLINTLIAVLLPARLIYYGMGSKAAVSEFGKIFGMAFPLITMPSTLIGSLALVLVPELSSNYYSGKFITLKNNIEKAIKFSVFTASLAVPIFLSLGGEIGTFLYDDASAGLYVAKAAVTMFPLSVSIITTSMLNSLNREKITLAYYTIGAAGMILCIYFLPKYLGVNALIVGTFVNYFISATLNLITLKKVSPEKINVLWYFIKALLFTVPSTILGVFLRNLLFFRINFVVALIIGCGITGLFQLGLFFVFGMIDFSENHKYCFKPFAFKIKGKATNKSA